MKSKVRKPVSQPAKSEPPFWLGAYRAFRLAKAGRLNGALAECNRTISEDSEFANGYAARAAVLLEVGDRDGDAARYGDAVRDCERAIELDPELGAAYAVRGTGLERLHRLDEAKKDFDRAVELSPDEPIVRKGREIFYRRHSDLYGEPVYTRDAPSSKPAVTEQQPPMVEPETIEDFNTKIKNAKAENLARRGLSAAHALATYKALVKNVDLLNRDLPEAERLTRAERLYKAYERVRKLKPDFRDTGQQMRAANRIRMAEYRRRKGAREAAQAAFG